MALIFCYTKLFNFNFYMLLCGKDALKHTTVHSSMAHVHVLPYKAAKQILSVTASEL
jgi:hypothetical protein